LRRLAAIAVIAVTILSLPPFSLSISLVAQAQQRADENSAAKMYRKTHAKTRRQPYVPQTEFSAPTPGAYSSVTPPCHNMAPPCMSTFPQEDPNYHGTPK